MRFIKGIGMGLIWLVLGLEIGGFCMWYLTMKAIGESRTEQKSYWREPRRSYSNKF